MVHAGIQIVPGILNKSFAYFKNKLTNYLDAFYSETRIMISVEGALQLCGKMITWISISSISKIHYYG